MNNRDLELGMTDTHFANPTGLPAEGHVTSARDIALMSRELIGKHTDIRRFTTIWMDTIRGGQFGLSNTNKLIRFYDGATGLKTGSTDAAGYCISATAERDGMELIAVVLGGETSQQRFEDAKTLLNYGFSAYALADVTPAEAPLVPIRLGRPPWRRSCPRASSWCPKARPAASPRRSRSGRICPPPLPRVPPWARSRSKAAIPFWRSCP